MLKKSLGIHHITAIVGHPQENVDFYAGVLGLRLVKQTVNFDDPGTYHLYFGNEGGQPGTIITFFPWADAYPGKIGDGQVGVTSYAVPTGSLGFWEQRLKDFNIEYVKQVRFHEDVLQFKDPHGLQLELVAREDGEKNAWDFAGVHRDVAIKGFAGATLFSAKPEQTSVLLETVMGLEKVAEEGEYIRFIATGNIGNIIDLKRVATGRGQMGVGTVHHIAWRALDDVDQLDWKKHVEGYGYGVTPVQDRNYFNAIYFREHGEILFEIATDPPGFAHDESFETMGEKLMLPSQYEPHRGQIEDILIPIEVRNLHK
ncbi:MULTISPECIES: ring-cleaving dioxygenase [unclassified Bacillus (in: firmicutes)]|uniref:ring-cleaving dioxygenase n=1 Tax=unclassified Bacillus (in: firmicutes) TaxID=185979 RepID=UPI0008E94818|nr:MULTISPECIES: ring-cleaving dioxygenase [unclassified Bacillus (in: firmicutes)]SFA89858.1 glyoxalase family protein [Bacillus sp. UNCCL13]SFQ85061.1 glyoxalase family protein [Bacillus sp. cl95]